MPLFQGRCCCLWGVGLPNPARLSKRDEKAALCQDTEVGLPNHDTMLETGYSCDDVSLDRSVLDVKEKSLLCFTFCYR